MKENITYGECLSEIIKALGIKSNKLAHEINIDPSLVYKWLRNERVPSYDSPYIDLTLDFISKRIFNPSQRAALTETLTNFGIELSEQNDADLIRALKTLLQFSQGYSIRLNIKKKSECKLASTGISSVAGFIKKIDIQTSESETVLSEKNRLGGLIRSEDMFGSDTDHVQIISGRREVIQALVSLLEQAPKSPLSDRNAILMTINSDFGPLLANNDISNVWIQKLHNLLSGGWKLILHVTLDHNVGRTIRIIGNIEKLLTIGNVSVYYKRSNDSISDTELCIVPGTGVLQGISTKIKNQTDVAFRYSSQTGILAFTDRFFQILNTAKPLLRSYPSQKYPEFQQAFAEAEEAPGEKCVFKGGLSTITIPLVLYKKYLEQNRISEKEFSYRSYLHKRRLDAFKEQVTHYPVRDLCFIESVKDLVYKRRYSFGEDYLIQNYKPQSKDIVCHLKYLVSLLETYENYQLAFMSKSDFEYTNNINWMVKNNACTLIETIPKCVSYDSRTQMNFSITEASVVSAFHDYFNILWDSVSDKHKNRKNTVLWLKFMIEKCSRLPK